MASRQITDLYRLARLFGVQTAYYDVTHKRRQAVPESLLSGLQALGAPVQTVGDVPAALRERQRSLWQRGVEPVLVTWQEEPLQVELRLPAVRTDGVLHCHLAFETGESQRWTVDLDSLMTFPGDALEQTRYVVKMLTLPCPLPWGYHRLHLELLGRSSESMVISAPLQAYVPPEGEASSIWGVFLPVYAARSGRSWGGGDFSDLEALITWVNDLGGGLVATLPLLASFLDEPFEPSPYSPVSRLCWNELYLDVARVPELSQCPAAVTLIESDTFRRELAVLRAASVVDYGRQMAVKRKVLEMLSRHFFSKPSGRHAELERFLAAHPQVEDYARFRAVVERQGTSWSTWPQPLRGGTLQGADYAEEARRYHLYVQWLAHEQLQSLAQRARQRGPGLYLDLPLGVHPDGYDVWRERELFAIEASGGSPPDLIFTKGQNWGFPPLRPETLREQGYRYVIAYVRHHLQFAGLLRIDHVMGLHRIFVIPRGLEARDGFYLRYPAEELYAIVSLESHRYKSTIVGENLGTVPPEVNPSLRRYHIQGMYVMQYELTPDANRPLRVVPSDVVASINTHDMPPFAAFWQGLDIEARHELGLLKSRGAQREQRNRRALRAALSQFLQGQGWLSGPTDDAYAVLRACLAWLSASRARVVLCNLEDLWQETVPQNTPATSGECLNWRLKARYTFEAFRQMPTVLDALREMDRLRKQRRGDARTRSPSRPGVRAR